MSTDIATKQDIAVEIAQLETKLTKAISDTQFKIISWLGGYMTILLALAKLLF